MAEKILGWAVAKWRFFWLRRRMLHFAMLQIKAREAGPELYRYLEALECRVDTQERELKSLRWTMVGERLGGSGEEKE